MGAHQRLRPINTGLLIALALHFLIASDTAKAADRPPLHPWRIAGETAIGAAAFGWSALSSLLATFVVYAPCADCSNHGADAFFQAYLYTSSAFLIPAGISLVGSTNEETGSYWASALGTTIGLIPLAILFNSTNLASDNNGVPDALLYGAFALPIVGGVIGFNLTREYRDSKARTPTALINSSKRDVYVAFPAVSVSASPKGHYALYAPIAQIRL